LRKDGWCYDFDLASDYLRIHATDIFDFLQKVFRDRINIRDWEEEIAAEAVRKTLNVWDSMNPKSPAKQTWEGILQLSIVQTLGRPLRVTDKGGPLSQAVASLHIQPQTEDSPLLIMARAANVREIQGESTQSIAKEPDTSANFAAALKDLLTEARWTAEEVAEKIGIDARNVYRHLSSETLPKLGTLALYETQFSKKLNRKITLPRQ
jgi:hypothetical protein